MGRSKRQGLALAMVLSGAATGASCFDGADALGLPCTSDEDCGKGQRCELGFCGGPPATGGSSSGSSSDSGSSTGSGSSESTAAESTGPQPGCGNGVVEPELGEDCDPGTAADAADCDADCTTVMCGDGHPNLEAAEECDDANASFLDDCTPECRTTLFWDDLEQDPTLGTQWLPPEIPVHEYQGADFSLAQGWRWGGPMAPGAWFSGPYSGASGTARITTRPITFPEAAGPGFRYEVRLRHRLRFDGNPQDQGACGESTGDGGVVWILDGEELRRAGPPPGHPDVLENPGLCAAELGEPDNPLFDPIDRQPAYAGLTQPTFVETGFPLPPDVSGKTVSLVFEVGYDCRNCWTAAPMDAGWTIDHVVVAAFPG